jgi:RimJ/RimL family protein N-acetyltransferase
MARRGRELVDGDGAPRVVAQLRTETLRLRRVRDEDCRLLWDWANDPMVREASFSPHQIPWEEHEAWFRTRMNDPDCVMYLAHDGENAVGQIRYDLEGEGATVSVSTSPEFRGRGYGSRMIRCGSQELFASTGAAWIDALIQPGNAASIAAFLKAGFVRNGTTIMRGLPAERLTLRRNEVRDERHD